MAHAKDNGLKNEIEVQIVYLLELIDRSQYFNHITIEEHKILLPMVQSLQSAVHKVIGEPEPQKEKPLTEFEEEEQKNIHEDIFSNEGFETEEEKIEDKNEE